MPRDEIVPATGLAEALFWRTCLEVPHCTCRFVGVIILESLTDPQIMSDLSVLRESDVRAPDGDPE